MTPKCTAQHPRDPRWSIPRRVYGKEGFTFLEILIALAIMGILAGVVGFSVVGNIKKARWERTRVQVQTIRSALKMYYANHSQYPGEEQGLLALCILPDIDPVPENYPEDGYLDTRKLPLDGWDREFVYSVPAADGSPYEILSYGADGEPGGSGYDADISTLDL